MRESYERILIRRRKNLRRLVREHVMTQHSLCLKLGWTSGSYLSQMIGPKPTRWIRESTARHIEQKLRLPQGWLDAVH